MKAEQFRNKLRKLKEAHLKQVKDLMLEYAVANDRVEVGDVVVGNLPWMKILVDRKSWNYGNPQGETPTCTLYGKMVDNNLKEVKPTKRSHMTLTMVREIVPKQEVEKRRKAATKTKEQ